MCKLISCLIRLLTLILWIGCTGCDSPLPYVEEKLVIEGWIDTDGYPEVQLTLPILPGQGETNLESKLIQWAKVTISDGETTVIMTGGPASNMIPPYRYYSYAFEGVPGRTYEIEAEYESLKARAKCTMPYPTPIKSIKIDPIEERDSLRAVSLIFDSPEDCPAYYCVTMRRAEKGERAYPAMLGTIAVYKPGEEIHLPVLNPKNTFSHVDDKFLPQLRIGQEVVISLCRVSEDVYNFWKEYDNVTMFGGSQFVSVGSLKGNVEGGYGVWSARGTSSMYVKIE